MEKKVLTGEDILYMQEQVIKFNEIAGNNVKDKSLIALYKSLTEEELLGEDELINSWNKSDMVGVLDGLIDSVFVSFYWAVLNGHGFSKNNTDKWYKSAVDEVDTYSTEELLGFLRDHLKHDNPFGYQTDFTVLLYKLSEKFDIVSAFDIINESNLSKFVNSNREGGVEQQDLDLELKYIGSQGRYGGVDYHKVGDYYVFTAKEDVKNNVVFTKSKIVKPSSFKEVEGLEQFIY